ncbi:HYR-like domain-containing protein [Formosa sp. A9]|uniref:HYR-like domain-containing protein n=1 Tax=Formosa sp. A9 TaxID=3442641 RepID=UPI003EBDE640
MKKLYPTPMKAYKKTRKLKVLALLLMLVSFYGYSQVAVPFTPRASDVTGKSVYNVKGNFVIIGNTNLELADYDDTVTDSNEMKYVDVDNNPSTLNSSEATLQLFLDDGSPADCSNIVYAGLYWTGRPGAAEEFTVTKNGITKTYNKRKATITGPNGVSTEITAQPDHINYPVGEFADMFSAYADVTTIVQQAGTGAYVVSDIALLEGLGGRTGYFGGWSMVVIYENSEMKRRNISSFDGYAYQSGFPSYGYISLDISNINTSPNGNITPKLGIMAGEGDFSIKFDYFEAYKGLAPDVTNNPIPFPDSQFQRLAHAGHTAGDQSNFFNSSIATEGNPRNPMLLNNTGMDLATFYLPNTGNVLIDNQQPSVLYRYSALQDSYIIYNLTMSFLAPAPEVEAEVAITDINGATPGPTTTIQPGQNMTYKVEVKNFGDEATENTMLSIPIPYNTTYQSLSYNGYPPYTANTAPYYDAASNSIKWDLGNLPLPTRTDKLLADLTFTVSATTDCSILAVDCADLISLNGTLTGSGITSGEYFDKTLITGFDTTSPDCINTPIPAPLETTIDAQSYIDANCGAVTSRTYYFCNYTDSTIPTSEVSGDFPIGTKFYNEFPLTAGSIEYNASNPFPATEGETTYYAVPQEGVDCAIEFNIDVNVIDSVPTVDPTNPEYCLNETAAPLTATPSDPSFILLYYVDNNPATAGQTTITPNTDVAGTFTYYVAEGPSADCISPNRVPITVIVHDVLNITSNITDASCTPGNDGSIDITVSGGSGNYTYVWSTGDTTEDITGLPTGDYTVTVTDQTTGCDTVSNFTINTDINSLPTITAPASYTLEGCDVTSITDLPSSTTPVSITIDQLENALNGGGTATGFVNITYADVVTGTCPVVVTRTFTAVNDCNNTATATQTITIEDNTAPAVPTNVPADVTIECSDPLPVAATLTTTDNCPASGTITGVVSETTNNTDPCNVTVTRTWTFTDACGNASDVSQIITIIDTTAPVLSGTPIDLILECDGLEKNSLLEEWLNIHANMTATDNCNVVTWTNDYDEDNVTDCASLLPVTFTATDACGNASSFTANYEIRDITGPDMVTQATDATFECGDDAGLQNWLTTNGGAIATDTCSEDIDWSNNFTVLSDDCGNTGSATVTFIAADSCGNETTTTATVSIVDTTAPILPTAPADLTVECLDDVPAPGELTATDSCSDDITVIGVDTIDSSNPCNIVVTRTWTFADACGNTAVTTQTINVIDTTAPVAPDAPADLTVECTDDIPTATDLTATDNCGGSITVSAVDTTNDTDPCNVIVTRTWTFADACGNTSTTVQNINVIDTTAPDAPDAPADVTIDCLDSLPAPIELTAPDNCGGIVTATGVDNIIPGDSCNQTVIRTWTFTDVCGNSSTTTQTITVDDDVPPVVISPAEDIVYYCTGEERNPATIEAWVTIYGGSIIEDNCSSVTWTNDYDPSIVACGQPIDVTFTATDECGNSVSTTASYTIIDETGPEIITEAQDITVDCNNAGDDANLIDWLNTNGGAIASDVCSDSLTWSNDFTADAINGSCGADNAITVTFTATDNCGNTSTSMATVTVIDTTAPTPPTAPADVTVECSDDIPAMIDLTATDNCGEDITVTGVDAVNDADPCNVIVTRTWTFTDACGNSSETSQIITVQDTTAPVVDNAPADVTVECSDDLPTMEDLTATDNCSGTITASGVETIDNSDACNVLITRTWTFTDTCGNTSTTTQTITVTDDTAPVITSPAEDIVYYCTGEERNPATIEAWVVIFGGALAEDNCSDVTWTNNYDPSIVNCGEPIEVIFTATDACGNASTTSATYTIVDETGPEIITAAQDITFECDATSGSELQDWLNTNGGATATDVCSDTLTWSNDFNADTLVGACGADNAITVTFTATDNCGNTTDTQATITINDDVAPELPTNIPADVTVACSEDVPAMVDLTATDVCAGDITVTGEDTVNDTDPTNVIITRSWTFVDDCGNTSVATQTITVQDTEAPVVDNAPEDLTLECLDDVPALTDLTATDNCSGTITAQGTETIENISDCHVVITRNWEFVDGSGNTTSVSQTITVNDDTAPVPNTTPEDLTLACIDDVPALADLTATDNCAGTITAQGSETTDNSNTDVTVITRTWTFTDNCGNTTEVSQTITVQDTEAPVVDNAPEDLTVACIDEVSALTDLTATDNCSGTITAQGTETIDDTDACNVTITRTWIFTDNAGNTSEVNQVIMVIDDVAPTAPAAPADVTVECTDSIPDMIDLTATDNCGAEITATGVDTENTIDSCSAIITRTWTFTDSCGNTSEVSQIITVTDETAPQLDGNLDTEITVNCSDIPERPELTFSDNCDADVNVVYNEINTSTGADYENYQVIRDWTVSDSCGNTNVYTQTINVNVQQLPVQVSDTKCTEGGNINLDNYLEDPNTDGTWVVDSGDTTLNGSTFDPLNVDLGLYVFTFTEAQGCQNQTTVSIEINDDCVVPPCDPQISETVTPNGDQYNEYFTVTGIESCGYGNIKVEIYNRWGALVFKSENYQNNWNGQNDKQAFGSSDHLPTGTYYYIVTFNNSGLSPKRGPIYLGTK